MASIKVSKDIYIKLFILLGIYIVFVFICEAVSRYHFKNRIEISSMVLTVLKLIFYGFLLFSSLFFDFKRKTISLMLPESITLTQLFITPITGFEVILNILDLIKTIKIVKEDEYNIE